MFIMFGIKNCDTIKKARAALEQQALPYQFHDYKSQGLSEALLDDMLASVPWQQLLNTRGTTWRQLPETQKTDVDAAKARQLLLEHPSMVKRPVLKTDNGYVVGFDVTQYQQLVSK